MASPPTTPRSPYHYHRPRSSSGHDFPPPGDSDWSPTSAGAYDDFFHRVNRSSRTSPLAYTNRSPASYRRMSTKSSRPPSLHIRKASETSIKSARSSQFGDLTGFGNLADELANVLDDEYGQGSIYLDNLGRESIESPSTNPIEMTSTSYGPYGVTGLHTSEFGESIQHLYSIENQFPSHPPPLLSSPRKQAHSRQNSKTNGHKRNTSAYDGSDYGPESEIEDVAEDLPPMLKKRIREVEAVTRLSTNTEDAVSEKGGVIKRTIHALKELNPQTNIEYGLTRLATAYTSMALHRTHKAREIFTQSHSLLYSGVVNIPEEVVDILLQEIDLLMDSIPASLLQQNPLLSLQILTSQTVELNQTLRSLTDALQESKIASNMAARQLKSVKDMVDDLRMEEELLDNSIMLIQAGDWDRRCRQRHAAKTCREVVDGFAALWGVEIEDEGINNEPMPVEVAVA